jgi:hypothetical protein
MKVRSSIWVLTEVVAEGDATSGIGSERKSSILLVAHRTDLVAETGLALAVETVRVTTGSAAVLAVAVAAVHTERCRLK